MTTFSTALTNLKNGELLRRAGWNGKGQFVYLHHSTNLEMYAPDENPVTFEPVLVLRNAQGKHQPGWLPSMGDLLADDWGIYEE